MNDAFLPESYEIPNKSNYTRLQNGENTLRILEKPILGYELWINNKPKRYKMGQDIPVSDVESADIDKRTGLPKPPKHFWAMVVWNYDQNCLQVWEITQKKIMTSLKNSSKSKAWGSPLDYDISITKEGEGLDTDYSFMPNPKTKVSPKIMEAYKNAHIDVDKLFTGDDPFSVINDENQTKESKRDNVSVVSEDEYMTSDELEQVADDIPF